MTTPKRKPPSAESIAQGAIEHDTRWKDVAEQIRDYVAEAVAQERAEWVAAVEAELRQQHPSFTALERKLKQARGTVKRGGKR